MQTRLTDFYNNFKIVKPKKKINYKIITIFISIIILIIILLVVAFTSKNVYWAEEQELYFLIADTNISTSRIASVTENVEDAGGSGVLTDLDEYKNSVIIFVYYNENDANKILETSKQLFQNSIIISKKVNKMSKNLQTKFQNTKGAVDVLKFITNEKLLSHKKLLEFEKGEISFNQLYQYSYKLRTEINALMSNLGDDEFSINLKNSLIKLSSILGSFIENNLESEYSSLYFKKFIVLIALEEISLKSDNF